MHEPSAPSSGLHARDEAVSVSELTFGIKATLEGTFSNVAVTGEVISARPASSGHMYFTLKDARAQLPCVVWRSTAQRLPVRLRDGMQITAWGDVQVYPPHGKYQLVVRRVAEAGLGSLLAQLEQLKQRLAAEGLLSEERKRPLPFLPRRVGVVTAATGAAIQDILTTIHRRFPARVLLYPCQVQGDGAAASVVRGLERLAAHPEVDVIIVGRGGGSLEDLWAFNDERVARAIAACPKPVVSAVGHETDTLLSDLVADRRAPTPTAAGECVVPSFDDLVRALGRDTQRLDRSMRRQLAQARLALRAERLRLGDPRRLVAEQQQRLDDQVQRLDASMRRRVGRARERCAAASGRLHNLHPRVRLRAARASLGALQHRLERCGRAHLDRHRRHLSQLTRALGHLSPTASLERGYAIVRTADGRVVRRSGDVQAGQGVQVILHRGALEATVVRTTDRHGFEAPVDAGDGSGEQQVEKA